MTFFPVPFVEGYFTTPLQGEGIPSDIDIGIGQITPSLATSE
jgi:hypothetical protein